VSTLRFGQILLKTLVQTFNLHRVLNPMEVFPQRFKRKTPKTLTSKSACITSRIPTSAPRPQSYEINKKMQRLDAVMQVLFRKFLALKNFRP
jgi:hypothetical protein